MSIYRNKQSKIGIELSNSDGVIELLTLNGEILKEDLEDVVKVSVHEDLVMSLATLKTAYINENKNEYNKQLSNILKSVL